MPAEVRIVAGGDGYKEFSEDRHGGLIVTVFQRPPLVFCLCEVPGLESGAKP